MTHPVKTAQKKISLAGHVCDSMYVIPGSSYPNSQMVANCGRAAAAEYRSVMKSKDESENLLLPLSATHTFGFVRKVLHFTAESDVNRTDG